MNSPNEGGERHMIPAMIASKKIFFYMFFLSIFMLTATPLFAEENTEEACS
jgi:hypothetical protein